MASVAYIPASKLASLLLSADPQKNLNVRVLDSARLSLETTTFQPVSMIDLNAEKIIVPDETFEVPAVTPKTSRKSGNYQLIAFGEFADANSLKELLAAGLLALETKMPGALEKLSKVKTRTKRIVANDPSDLFGSATLSDKYSAKLMDGWWYGTNNSAQETNAWLMRACECAGVKWGKDFSTSL